MPSWIGSTPTSTTIGAPTSDASPRLSRSTLNNPRPRSTPATNATRIVGPCSTITRPSASRRVRPSVRRWATSIAREAPASASAAATASAA